MTCRYTLWSVDISLFKYGDHTLLEYSMMGLTIDLYNLVKMSISRLLIEFA